MLPKIYIGNSFFPDNFIHYIADCTSAVSFCWVPPDTNILQYRHIFLLFGHQCCHSTRVIMSQGANPHINLDNEGDFAQEIWTNGSTTISQKSYWSDYFRWRNLCVQFLKVKYYSSNCWERTFWLLNFQSRISGGNRCFYITLLQRKSIPSMAPLVGKNCTHGIFSHVVKLMKTEMKISTVVFPN